MIESKGELIWCPFRTRKHFTGVKNGDIETTHFMPCMKEDCICYERYEYDDVITENCYRENIGYTTSWNKKSGNDIRKTYSKDYFEGMKKFANIILGELGDVAEYYNGMSRTFKGSQESGYNYREEAIDEAMDIINAVLHLQLEAEED